MEESLKQLLLKDLSARLLFDVKIKIGEYSDYKLIGIVITDEKPIKVEVIENGIPYKIEVSPDIIKPHLRPISSMTEEEVNKLFHILKINEKNANEWIKVNDIGTIRLFTEEGKDFYEIADAINYLHSIHIDYSGLIEKGLAIEITEENNLYKE